jgi:hypothetical protein
VIARLCRLRSLAETLRELWLKRPQKTAESVAEEGDVVSIAWADESEAGPMSERPEALSERWIGGVR